MALKPTLAVAGKPSSDNVQYEVYPKWAKDAVNLTGTSLEVSFEHLRTLYSQTQDQPAQEYGSNPVQITLRPKFSGRLHAIINPLLQNLFFPT